MTTTRLHHYLFTVLMAVGLLHSANVLQAEDGTWLGQSGNWSDPALWQDGTVPAGAGAGATFTVPFEEDRTIRLDTDVTLGAIFQAFGGGDFFSTLSLDLNPADPNRVLSLDNAGEAPVIHTENLLEINARLDGDDGLVKTGPGMLRLRRDPRELDSVEQVFSFTLEDDAPIADFEDAGGRRYTTWAETRAGGIRMVVTASNAPDHNNPGPGWTYIPTGVDWEPNTAYLIDFTVYGRTTGGQNIGANVEYGLWAGLPEDDKGTGDYNNLFGPEERPGNAATRPSLGTQGRVVMSEPSANTVLRVSELTGASEVDEHFVFVTGDDVSGLDEMVLFIRNGEDGEPSLERLHWTDLELVTLPEEDIEAYRNPPETEPNLFSGTIELQEGFFQLGGQDNAWGVDTDFLISGDAGFWSNTGGTPAVSQDVTLAEADMTVFGFDGNDRTVVFEGNITGSGGLIVDGETTNVNLLGANTFDGAVTIGPGGQTGAGSNHTRLTVGGGVDDATTTLGDGSNPVILGGSQGASLDEGEDEVDGTSALRFVRDTYTFSGDISGRGVVEVVPGDTDVLLGTTLTLTGNNTYEGKTYIQQGALRVDSPSSFPSTANLHFDQHAVLLIGADLAPGSAADFDWPVGTGPGEVQWTDGGGFAAAGEDRVVNLGNNAPIVWDDAIGNVFALFLGHPAADATLTFANPINLTGEGWRNFRVQNGSAEVDGVVAGVISGSGVGIIKNDAGTLVLNSANTYDGMTGVNAGTLALGSGGSINNTGGVVLGPNGTFDVTAAGSFTFSGGMVLRGAGTVVGPVSVTDGFIRPGSTGLTASSGVGNELTVEELSLNNQALYLFDMDSRVADSGRLLATGDVDLGGAFLDMVDVAEGDEVELPEGTRIVILDYTGRQLSGTFSGLPEGAEISPFLGEDASAPVSDLNTFTIHYNDFTDGENYGNFVTLRVGTNPYDQWAMDAGLTGEDLLPTADPDEDGVVNLLEFALGGDPLTADESVLPGKALTTGDVVDPNDNLIANSHFLVTMTDGNGMPHDPGGSWFTRPQDKVDLDDPVTWVSEGGPVEQGVTAELPGWRTVTADGDGLLVAGGSDLFFGAWGGAGDFEDDGGVRSNAYDAFRATWVEFGSWLPDSYWEATTGNSLVTRESAFVYIPTGIQVEPNTTYTIDLAVGHRSGFGGTLVEYGLWHGLPDEGNLSDPMNEVEAWTRDSLGVQGFFDMDANLGGGEWGYLGEVSGGSDSDVLFRFTTGPDVSQFDEELVFFMRNVTADGTGARVYWDNLTVRVERPDTEAMAAVRYVDQAYVASTVPASELSGGQTYELRFDFGVQGDADWSVLRDAVVAEIREGGSPGAVLDLSGEPEPSGLESRGGRPNASFTLVYTAPAEPVDLEIRLGGSGAGVGGPEDQFRFDNVTLLPVPDQEADYVFSFNRRKGSEQGVNLFFEFSNNLQGWTRLPVEAGPHGEAVVSVNDHPSDPDLDQVQVTVPSRLAAVGRGASGELFGRVHAKYIGSDLFVATAGLDVPDVDPFTQWADAVGLTGADRAGDADPDGDGIPNLLEFVLDGNPLASNRAILPVAEVITDENGDPDSFVFTFHRRQDSVGSVDLDFEYTGDLGAEWTRLAVESGMFGSVSIDISDQGDGRDLVVITVPVEIAQQGRIFGRLHAAQAF